VRTLYVRERNLYFMRSLILSQCRDFRTESSDVRRFWGSDNSTINIVLDVLKSVYFGLRKIIVQ